MISATAASAIALPLARRVHAGAAPRERWIELMNTHTNETVSVAYRNLEGYVPEALRKLDHVLRDHRSGKQQAMDRGLFDLLADLADSARHEPRYQIISGYRSPDTNAKLAARSGGVSPRSLHVQGRAIDVRLTGFATAELRDLALTMKRGGVGYYERSDFVHLDTGRVRVWSG